MAMETHYDAIVIGSGQAGGPLSTALAQAGQHTALIERVHVGGCCINEGCTPTKTMVASARVAYLARRGSDYGVQTGPVSINMAKVRERKRAIVNSFRGGSEKRITETKGVDLLMGEATFTAAKAVEVRLLTGETLQLTADKIFINTGARPSAPSVPGLLDVPVLNSTTIMELDTVPRHLIVLGGGYIGLEFGQMFRRFGSDVTVVNRGGQLLGREDPDIAEEVAKILREDGIEVLLDTSTIKAAQAGDVVELTVRTAEGERTLTGSHLLVAAGRSPNTEWLNLDVAGIETEKGGFIKVNEKLETNVAGVWALGDVKGGPAFTHISYDDFRIIRTNLIETPDNPTASIHARLVPYTVFIDPQLGRIGLNETEAKEQKVNYKLAKMPMNYVARALELDEARGLMKVLVDPDTKQILGATILGIEGGEVMAMLQIAMMGKLPYPTLQNAVFAHPTLAESLNNLFGNIS